MIGSEEQGASDCNEASSFGYIGTSIFMGTSLGLGFSYPHFVFSLECKPHVRPALMTPISGETEHSPVLDTNICQTYALTVSVTSASSRCLLRSSQTLVHSSHSKKSSAPPLQGNPQHHLSSSAKINIRARDTISASRS